MAGLGGVLGGAGTALEAYKRRLGGSLGRLGAILGALEAMLQSSGRQKVPKTELKMVPNMHQHSPIWLRLGLNIGSSCSYVGLCWGILGHLGPYL